MKVNISIRQPHRTADEQALQPLKPAFQRTSTKNNVILQQKYNYPVTPLFNAIIPLFMRSSYILHL
jgi:hypothetical protein